MAETLESDAETIAGLKALLLRQEENVTAMQDENVRLLQQVAEAKAMTGNSFDAARELSECRHALMEFVNRMAAVAKRPKIAALEISGEPEDAIRDMRKHIEYGNALLVSFAIGQAAPKIIT